MPVADKRTHRFDGQQNFGGGMFTQGEPGANQYSYGENWQIRDGKLTTRPGMRSGLLLDVPGGFWFGDPVLDDPDSGNTAPYGFWFDETANPGFTFRFSSFLDVQGMDTFQFPDDPRERIIFVSSGVVFVNDEGFVKSVPTVLQIDNDESIDFVQANNLLFMFRDEGDEPMQWDGSDAGFVQVPESTITGLSDIPYADRAVYQAGRLWTWFDGDTVAASDILDFSNWDLTDSFLKITGMQKGDGDDVVTLYPFHEDLLLIFKEKSVHALSNVHSTNLVDDAVRRNVDNVNGLIGKRAVTTVGEQVWFLSRRGVISLQRNQQNKLDGIDLPVSWDIQKVIDRINWEYADGAVADTFDNYVYFAVPLDNARRNNVLLVYDTIANNGRGAWCGIWRSSMTRPVSFFKLNQEPYFLTYDGIPVKMFNPDPVDSYDPLNDAEIYNSGVLYEQGSVVRFEQAGTFTLYRSLVESIGVDPTNNDTWEAIDDPQHAFDLDSLVYFRPFYFGELASGKRRGREEVLFRHSNPKLTLSVRSPDDPYKQITIFEDVEYPIDQFDVYRPDAPQTWDATNFDLDWRDPDRQDYAWIMGVNGTWMDESGIEINHLESHSLRFHNSFCTNQKEQMILRNTRGIVSVESVTTSGELQKYAARDR